MYHFIFWRWYYINNIKIGFIGPGKVCINLARYFTHYNLNVVGIYGRNKNHNDDIFISHKCEYFNKIEDLIKQCNIIFITTPDDIISKIDLELSRFDLRNKSVCHCSGSLNSQVLSNVKHANALVYSIHPLFAFSNKNIPIEDLKHMYFSIEGDKLYKNSNINELKIIKILKNIPNKFFIRNADYSVQYHIANVMASNFILSLLNIAVDYMKMQNISEEEALNALKPLIQNNINSIFSRGFKNSLTGPAVRNDINTILKHKEKLKAEHINLYDTLSLNLLKISDENANEKYAEMCELLRSGI